MVIENKKQLEAKIELYCKAGAFDTARAFARKYYKIEGFVQEEAEFKILKLEEAAQVPNIPVQPVQPEPAVNKENNKEE